MLWVTIFLVYCPFSPWMSSSTFAVAIIKSAEQGWSIKRTSGSTASARAMQSRCCWPPERLSPGFVQIVFHFHPIKPPFSMIARALRLRNFRSLTPFNRRPTMVFSPIIRSSETDWISGTPYDAPSGDYKVPPFCVEILTMKKHAAFDARVRRANSCIRLSTRMNVNFLQPLGPMMAVTALAGMSRLTWSIARAQYVPRFRRFWPPLPEENGPPSAFTNTAAPELPNFRLLGVAA